MKRHKACFGGGSDSPAPPPEPTLKIDSQRIEQPLAATPTDTKDPKGINASSVSAQNDARRESANLSFDNNSGLQI